VDGDAGMNAGFDQSIADFLDARGVSALTHFTGARNLPRLIETGSILATQTLVAEQLPYHPTDAERMDGHAELVCCNIELPNTYYFAKAIQRPNAINYPDWVILLLDPGIAGWPGTLFAPRNAAKGGGRELEGGLAGLERLYEPTVFGLRRGSHHRDASPTDVQAEVLIRGPIPLEAVWAIVVPSELQVVSERLRLEQIGHDPNLFTWMVSDRMFDRNSVVNSIRQNALLPVASWPDEEVTDSR
jgi:hypothetical protein